MCAPPFPRCQRKQIATPLAQTSYQRNHASQVTPTSSERKVNISFVQTNVLIGFPTRWLLEGRVGGGGWVFKVPPSRVTCHPFSTALINYSWWKSWRMVAPVTAGRDLPLPPTNGSYASSRLPNTLSVLVYSLQVMLSIFCPMYNRHISLSL